MDDAHRYACLEKGARHLASLARTEAERLSHLGWANRYHRWQIDAVEAANTSPEIRTQPVAA